MSERRHGNEHGEACSESLANLEVNFMEFGHWIGVGWERGGGRQGEKGEEDNSGFLHCALGGPVMPAHWEKQAEGLRGSGH